MPNALETGHPEDEQPPDPRYYSIMEGTVVTNRDPRGLGRVRVRIPGLIDPPGSAWAFPAGGLGGGAAQLGAFDVPPDGATVYVFFLGGDVDKPRYLAGHWGAPAGVRQTPTAASDAYAEDGPAGPPDVRSWETPAFALTFDDRDGKARIYVHAKDRGQELDGSALMFELDAEAGTVAISAPVAIVLRTQGQIDIDGMVVQVAGRKVLQIDKGI